jgi:polyisoprenoid-binding protein YceI
VSSPARYGIDQRSSRVTARAFAGGALSALGHNPTFAARDVAGAASLDPATGEVGSLTVVIKAASLALTDPMSDKDRREIEHTLQQEVLESAKYPEITYVCPARQVSVAGNGGQLDVTLNGDLTLHGVTRSHPIRARAFLTGEMLRGSAESTLRPSEFGIKLVTAAAGMLRVKDEVKLMFDLVARKQD